MASSQDGDHSGRRVANAQRERHGDGNVGVTKGYSMNPL